MSDFTVTELLLLQLFLIILNAIFACAEIAVISINDTRLKRLAEGGNKRAQRLVSLTAQPAKFLATIQVGITLAGFLGSAFAADNFSDRIVDWMVAHGSTISPAKLDVLAVIGITLILSYVTLILGELVPKRIAMQHAEKIGLAMSGMIYVIAKIFAPLVWLLTASTNVVLRTLGINPDANQENVTEEEIRIMVDVGSENGAIDDMEKEIIHNVFEFDDKTAEKVMTHRLDIIFLNSESSLEEWEKIMINSRFSVYPVCDKNIDGILGTLSIKDYFKFKHQGRDVILQKAMKPAQFIRSTLHIDELFALMQKSRNHFAVVVDEYGGVEGIATMNDLLEEIVGELEDDNTLPPSCPDITQKDEKNWIVRGYTPIEDVEECLKIHLPEGDYDTFAGFVLSLSNEFPSEKKNMILAYQNLSIKVLSVKRRKIEEVLVTIVD